MKEIWKEIKGYPRYDVSNMGRVRSWCRRGEAPKILRLRENNKGYFYILLRDHEQKKKHFLIARLVLKAFVLNPENKATANHIDEDKSNNCTSNLEWMTVKENVNHGTGVARRTKTQLNGKLSMPVLQLTLSGQIVRSWPSTKEAGRNGFDQGHISAICRCDIGCHTHKGFKWVYVRNYLKNENNNYVK